MGKRELVAWLLVSFGCHVAVNLCGCTSRFRGLVVLFHTHLLFYGILMHKWRPSVVSAVE